MHCSKNEAKQNRLIYFVQFVQDMNLRNSWDCLDIYTSKKESKETVFNAIQLGELWQVGKRNGKIIDDEWDRRRIYVLEMHREL